MPGVGVSWKDEHRRLRYSLNLIAPSGATYDMFDIEVAEDGTELSISYSPPSKVVTGSFFLDLISDEWGRPLFGPMSTRMSATDDAFDDIKVATGLSFRSTFSLPFRCLPELKEYHNHPGGKVVDKLVDVHGKDRIFTILFVELVSAESDVRVKTTKSNELLSIMDLVKMEKEKQASSSTFSRTTKASTVLRFSSALDTDDDGDDNDAKEKGKDGHDDDDQPVSKLAAKKQRKS